jgi:hypothetical protein
VKHISPRALLGAGLLIALLLPAPGLAQPAPKKKGPDLGAKAEMNRALQRAEDEYRLYFRRPEKVPEYWAAINFEIDVGKFDVAALILDHLLKKQPAADVDKELVKIEEAKGMSVFLRLLKVRKWYDNRELQKDAERNVELLLGRVTTAVEKTLGDPKRIQSLIKGLSGRTAEERSYAFVQLYRTRDRATPYLVDGLRQTAGTLEHERIKEAMLKLAPEILPPTFEVLRARNKGDANDVDLRLTLLDLIRLRGETRAIPYLWHLSAAPKYPLPVRERARQTLATLLETDPDKLPRAAVALTQLAEQYYQHRVKFRDPRHIRLWPWDGQKLARPGLKGFEPVELAASQAEQYFGTLFAEQALDLEPAYRPAQEVLLSMNLERMFAPNLDEILMRPMPDSLYHLLATIDAELVMKVLERALDDRNVAVILPLVVALGERGEFRAARPSGQGTPRGLLRALYYPDRRVQVAALAAYLRLAPAAEPATAGRVVELLRRFLNAEPTPKALVAFLPELRAAPVREALKKAGFEAVLTAKTREAVEKLRASADFDVILIHDGVLPAELPFLLGQLRADRDVGLLPVLVLSSPARKAVLTRATERFVNVWVVDEKLLDQPKELKAKLDESIKLAVAPAVLKHLPDYQRRWLIEDINQTRGQTLSAKERKSFTDRAMFSLWQMARGDVQGYDVRPAQQDIINALQKPDLATPAIQILGRLPGAVPQQRLAHIALDKDQPKLRREAAYELNRHIRTNGLLLSQEQFARVREAYQNPKEPPELRSEFALVLGQRELGSRRTGERLRNFTPEPPRARNEKE